MAEPACIQEDPPSTGRRAFLIKLPEKILYASCAALLSYPVLAFISFKKSTIRKVVFKKGEVLEGIVYRDGVFLEHVKGRYRALSARCTHLGCTVNYDPVSKQFRCPCHGSRYDFSGRRLAGPARKNLRRLPVRQKAGGELVVTVTL